MLGPKVEVGPEEKMTAIKQMNNMRVRCKRNEGDGHARLLGLHARAGWGENIGEW